MENREQKEKLERIKLELEELKRRKAEVDREHQEMMKYDEATRKMTITGAAVCIGSLAYSLFTKDSSGGLFIGTIGAGIIGESVLFNSSNLHMENREYNDKLSEAINDCKDYLSGQPTCVSLEKIYSYDNYLSDYKHKNYVKDSITKGLVGNAIAAMIGLSVVGGINLYKDQKLKNDDAYSSSSVVYQSEDVTDFELDEGSVDIVNLDSGYTLKKLNN